MRPSRPTLGRRAALTLIASAGLGGGIGAGPGRARAANAWPAGRTITLVVPFTPGGGVDIVARGVADRMSRDLGAPVIVDNRPGGSTVVASSYVSRADPDGATVLVGTPALSISAALLPNRPPGDPRKVFAPIARLANLPYLLVVSPSLPVQTVPELIAYAKAHPGKLTMANTGPLTAPRMAAELFANIVGAKITTVPFRGGGQAEIEITAGRVDGGFSQMSEGLAMQQAGARLLAVSTLHRTPLLPDLPTMAEFLPRFDVGSWNGLYAPAGTPPAIIDRLNRAVNVATSDPDTRARYAKLGYELIGGTPDELASYLDGEIAKWSALQKVVDLPTN